MKKTIWFILVMCFFLQNPVFAETDWDELYNTSKPFELKLMNSIDPFQDEETIKYSYTPYPLLRTSSYLYYRNFAIAPGYYQLTPRKMNGKYYLFFKDNGKVKFIIPIVKRELVPAAFYKKYMPDPKLTLGQTIAKNWKHFWSRIFKGSGKQPPPPSFLEMETTDAYFILKLYFKDYCYFAVFKKVPY